jgi:hypothetical protein
MKNGEIILYANRNVNIYKTHTVVETGGGDVTDLLLSHKTKVLYKSDCHESNIKGKCHDVKTCTKEILQNINK